MNNQEMSLRKMATILGVSQPFLSQIRAGKRPMPEALRTKVEALGAYHLLIGDKHFDTTPADEAGRQVRNIASIRFETSGGGEGNRTLGPLHAKRTTPYLSSHL